MVRWLAHEKQGKPMQDYVRCPSFRTGEGLVPLSRCQAVVLWAADQAQCFTESIFLPQAKLLRRVVGERTQSVTSGTYYTLRPLPNTGVRI